MREPAGSFVLHGTPHSALFNPFASKSDLIEIQKLLLLSSPTQHKPKTNKLEVSAVFFWRTKISKYSVWFSRVGVRVPREVSAVERTGGSIYERSQHCRTCLSLWKPEENESFKTLLRKTVVGDGKQRKIREILGGRAKPDLLKDPLEHAGVNHQQAPWLMDFVRPWVWPRGLQLRDSTGPPPTSLTAPQTHLTKFSHDSAATVRNTSAEEAVTLPGGGEG